MSREGGLLIVLGVAAVLLVLMFLGWRRRTRRDAHLIAPLGAFPVTNATVTADGLYVATTAHEEPLNRLAIGSLAFRARMSVAVDEPGVMLAVTGSETILIPAREITAVDRASFTIDRVVERDGLVRLSWRIDADTIVDTYLRLQQTDPETLIAAIRTLIADTAVTGTDA